VEKSRDEAVKWYVRAAEQGYTPAEVRLKAMHVPFPTAEP